MGAAGGEGARKGGYGDMGFLRFPISFILAAQSDAKLQKRPKSKVNVTFSSPVFRHSDANLRVTFFG